MTGGPLPPVRDLNEASPVGVDRAEDVSFGKVHRGERTPIELYLAGTGELCAPVMKVIATVSFDKRFRTERETTIDALAGRRITRRER